MKALASLKDGYMTMIGIRETSFWYDKWLEDGRVCDTVEVVHITDTNLPVRDAR